MNASDIISDSMTLEQKLQAIDEAMAKVQEQAKEKAKSLGKMFVPVDPSDLTTCEGCQ